jgi:hypothetical protein
MAITAGVNHQFKMDVLLALHNFTLTTGNAFWMALYPTAATLGPTTATYSSTGEHAATGTYTLGGKVLTNITPVLNGNEGCVSFQTLTWANSTITAGGAQIYNVTNSNKNVAVLNFGGDKVSSAGDFTVTFPPQTAGNAIIRIT